MDANEILITAVVILVAITAISATAAVIVGLL
jgi:hypothetical protein